MVGRVASYENLTHFIDTLQVSAVILPYDEALEQCGGSLPDYIPKVSSSYTTTIAPAAFNSDILLHC